MNMLSPWVFFLIALGTASGAMAAPAAPARARTDSGETQAQRAGREMVASEAVIASLGEHTRALAQSLRNLRLPDLAARSFFSPQVEVSDLRPPNAERRPGPAGSWSERWKSAGQRRKGPRGQLALWRSLFDRIDSVTDASFKVVRGRFLGPHRRSYQADIAFEAHVGLRDHMRGHLQGHLRLRLVRVAEHPWRIAALYSDDALLRGSGNAIFRDVTAEVVRDPSVQRRLLGSKHEEFIVQAALRGADFMPPSPFFQFATLDRHPAVSIADIDADGFDDIYVMPRWGKNMLLHNRGDGTFDESAARFGLDLDSYCTAAVFADFDNDGDLDAFVGRSLRPSVYLINHGGRYSPASGAWTRALPPLVSGLAAADYDGDGWLDIHVATYWADEIHARAERLRLLARSPFMQGIAFAQTDPWQLFTDFLDPADARRLHHEVISDDYQPRMRRPGPPNLILRNRGEAGGFESDPRASGVRAFVNTFQCAWSDVDSDGDPDLYCANDFHSNQLFINGGDGHFEDQTAAWDVADAATFAMSVSFGDYNQDGRPDLYVANMFSKAGRRITAQLPGIDARWQAMARGNTLLRHCGTHFARVSGLEAPSLQVEKAGWSWGAQFVDIDNDGDLDIYAPNGQFTAPSQVALQVDN